MRGGKKLHRMLIRDLLPRGAHLISIGYPMGCRPFGSDSNRLVFSMNSTSFRIVCMSQKIPNLTPTQTLPLSRPIYPFTCSFCTPEDDKNKRVFLSIYTYSRFDFIDHLDHWGEVRGRRTMAKTSYGNFIIHIQSILSNLNVWSQFSLIFLQKISLSYIYM